MVKEKAKKKDKKRGRRERRFLPTSSTNHIVVYVVGALGALCLGAGIWGYWFGHFVRPEEATVTPIFVLSTAGALLTVIAIWLGTSSEAALRVGDPGIAREKGELLRMPWYGISNIVWESGASALVVTGKDEHDKSQTFRVPARSHSAAAAWLVKEASARIPKVIDIPDSVRERFSDADPHAGTVIELEPMQVVGKKCSKSGKLIAYEPDARVCPRCERIYFKTAVPSKCKCGEKLAHLRARSAEPDEEEEETADDAESSGESRDTGDSSSA
jgi:hypothetical protein